MKTATKNLENDHEYILRLIDVMEAITRSAVPVTADLETIVELIRNYADGIHHEKEEQLLFPLMAEKGFSPEQGPVAVMLHEHKQGRQFVAGIRAGIELMKSGHANAVGIIYENMKGYISLLRNHISKENNVLFRMADQAFSEEEQARLLNEFARVEKGGGAESIVPSYVSVIESLAKNYLAK